jgi:hypothetical protein
MPGIVPMRTAPRALDLRNFAIASGCESATPSHRTLPPESTTQIEVFLSEASSPTYQSIVALHFERPLISPDAPGEPIPSTSMWPDPELPHVEKRLERGREQRFRY